MFDAHWDERLSIDGNQVNSMDDCRDMFHGDTSCPVSVVLTFNHPQSHVQVREGTTNSVPMDEHRWIACALM